MGDRSIRDAINQIAGTHLTNKVHAVTATVLSVDIPNRICTCQIVDGHVNNILPNVKLMASVDDGFLIQPTVNSTVCLIISDFSEPYISQYSGIDKIILNGGDLGGLVKVITLTKKINTLENKVNALVTKYNNHTHNVIAVGIPVGPNLLPEVGFLTPTQQIEIENKTITHG